MLAGKTLSEKAAFENGRLAGTDWKFRWRRSLGNSHVGPGHWAQWNNSDGYSVGEVDAGLYMACGPAGGLKNEDGEYKEWLHAADAMVDIDKLLGKRR